MNKSISFDLKTRINHVYYKLIWPLYIDSHSDYRKTVFLGGTERSGSTWVSDLINYNNDYRYIFEPFWPLKVPECKGFKSHQYIRPNNCDSYFLRTTSEILSGRVRNPWTDQYHRKFFASKRLIKDIRANLFLKWLKLNFPEMPIVFLIRHPCAVAKSFLRRKRDYSFLKPFLDQRDLINDYLKPFLSEIEQIESDLEAIIFSWCIQNYVPLMQFNKDEIHIIFYEMLCEYPGVEIDNLFSFLGKSYDKKIFKNFRKPSPQSFQESAVVSGDNLVNSWQKYFTNSDVKKCIKILKLFGFDSIYNDNPMPNVNGLQTFIDINRGANIED